MSGPAGPAANQPAWTRESRVLRLGSAVDLHDLSPDWAWGEATGAGVRVAIIDSGIEADHPQLEGCVDAAGGMDIALAAGDEVTLTGGPHTDHFGHGTACASIVHKLAPQATIVSVRVLGAGLSGKSSQFLAGLRWAVEQRFDVINLSLGSTRKEWALPFHEVCDQAYFAGSLVVTAANNLQKESYPSLFASVTSVACNTGKDPFRFHWNPEPPTEFLAPGIDIEVAWKGGGTSTVTGNSYAAPHIAGIAALIKSKHRDLRPFQLKTALCSTAANVTEARARGGALRIARPEEPGRLTRVLKSLPESRSTIFLGSAATLR